MPKLGDVGKVENTKQQWDLTQGHSLSMRFTQNRLVQKENGVVAMVCIKRMSAIYAVAAATAAVATSGSTKAHEDVESREVCRRRKNS